jgi:hypothetical protein
LPANGLGDTGIAVEGWQEDEGIGVLLDLAAEALVFGMNVSRVRHEAGGQCGNSRAGLGGDQQAICLNVLSSVCVVSVPVDVLADVSEPPNEASIEVDEGDFEMRRQNGADRALTGATGTDQSNIS